MKNVSALFTSQSFISILYEVSMCSNRNLLYFTYNKYIRTDVNNNIIKISILFLDYNIIGPLFLVPFTSVDSHQSCHSVPKYRLYSMVHFN